MTTILLAADWCPMDLNAEVIAPKKGSVIDRNPAELTAVVAQFENQPRYEKRDVTGDGIDESFCNFFVREVLKALGVSIPRGRCNDLIKFFMTSSEWERVSEWMARDLSGKAGRPVIAIWKNPDQGRSGHIAIVVPSRNELDRDTTFIAQAGISNFIYGRLKDGFGSHTPVFYARC